MSDRNDRDSSITNFLIGCWYFRQISTKKTRKQKVESVAVFGPWSRYFFTARTGCKHILLDAATV